MHLPTLAPAVPLYENYLLSSEGLFRIDRVPVAEQLHASSLAPGDFGLTLKAEDGTPYGTLRLDADDASGFSLEVYLDQIDRSGLLQPLVTSSAEDRGNFLGRARVVAEGSVQSGYSLIHSIDGQAHRAAALSSVLAGAGWKVRTAQVRRERIWITRSPASFLHTTYFR